MEGSAARALLAVLAECWPDEVDLESVVIQPEGPGRIVVTVWTPSPGRLIGHPGSGARETRERLRAAAPGKDVALRVRTLAEVAALTPDLPREASLETSAPARDLVPDLVGMIVGEAHAKALSSGFSLRTADPDGVPITFFMAQHQYGHWVVVGQSPLPGVLARLRSVIEVAIEERGGGGESGDREPRVPGPPAGTVHFEQLVDLTDLQYVEDIE